MRELLSAFRAHFFYVGVFTLFINVLALAVPLYTLQVFDRVFSSRSLDTLLMLTVAVVFAIGASALIEIARSRLLLMAGILLEKKLGERVLKGLLQEAVRPGGAGYRHGLRDIAILRSFLGGSGVVALFDAPWVPLFMVVIFLFHPLFGVAALVGAVALFALAWLNERITRGPQQDLMERSRQTGRLVDIALRNAEVVRALSMENAIARQWAQKNEGVIESHSMGTGRASGMLVITKAARLLIQVVMMCVGAYLAIRQQITSGGMMAGTIILARALAPVEAAISSWKGLVDSRGAYRRLSDLLASLPPERETFSLPSPKGNLSVERLVYAFKKGESPILKGLSFRLDAGESLGIIGPSGAGKSTLARVLAGVWEPTSGAVRLDGADIADWNREQLARHLGYLPQDVELFPGSVADNISRLATSSPEAVVAAAQSALAHDMILRLPNGYETELGEGGLMLSGGQRQRVGYARALHGEPRLVILDEPNSNLDGEGEEALVRSMAMLRKQGVTIIIITHKPSILTNVDKMLLLREGAVEIFGTRQEVMAHLSRYSASRNESGRGNQGAGQAA